MLTTTLSMPLTRLVWTSYLGSTCCVAGQYLTSAGPSSCRACSTTASVFPVNPRSRPWAMTSFFSQSKLLIKFGNLAPWWQIIHSVNSSCCGTMKFTRDAKGKTLNWKRNMLKTLVLQNVFYFKMVINYWHLNNITNLIITTGFTLTVVQWLRLVLVIFHRVPNL